MSNVEKRKGFCRVCLGFCGIEVYVVDGRVVRVAGDPVNPISGGFTCSKGRAIPEQLSHPGRLLHAMRKGPDEAHHVIDSRQAMAEAAERFAGILAQHGPRSVALYFGTGGAGYLATMATAFPLWSEIGSPMAFHPGAIDQPGKQVASAVHGYWQGGAWGPDDADVWMFMGTNPMSTMWAGTCIYNPVQTLRTSRKRDMKVIVVDPRRTELARHCDLHLAIRPGADPVLLAGLIRLLLTTGRCDAAFLARHAKGLDVLRETVEPFTLPMVAERTELAGADIELAADFLASSRRGGVTAGTGPNMAPEGVLTEYLILCLQTIRGFWCREGDPVPNPGTFTPQREWREQAARPRPAAGFGEKMRVEGFGQTAAGMPTGLLADEMLIEGPGRVRALINLGGNPISAWPDEAKVRAAIDNLDLLVTADVRMSATAIASHYVFGTKFHLEVPAVTATEGIREYGAVCDGFRQPFAQYMPALSTPPEGSDLIEEWELMVTIARKLGLPLSLGGFAIAEKPEVTTDDIIDAMFAHAQVKPTELRGIEGGVTYSRDVRVAAADAAVTGERRLELGGALGLAGLSALATEPAPSAHPFRLVCRRMKDMKNSWGTDLKAASKRYGDGNPLWLHPDDLAALGLVTGDRVELYSDHGAIETHVQADADGLRGVVSLAHGWGAGGAGVNVNRLTHSRIGLHPVTAMPVFSALPVSIRRLARVVG